MPPLYVSPDRLRRALSVPAGVDQDADLLTACEAASRFVDAYLGVTVEDPMADPPPAQIEAAALQVAVRVYTADDVARGTYQTDLGVGFTGRVITPELEALFLGQHRAFGVA